MTEISPSTQSALDSIESIPRQDNEPVFKEPWEAEAFAMTLALYEAGVFTWTDWAAALSSAISKAQEAGDPDLGDTYYHHWLTALESLVVERGLGSAASLHNLASAWREAAETTPHGDPIELTDDTLATLLK